MADLKKLAKNLENNNFHATIVENGKEALATIKKMIPKGASVNNGASVTLEQIGLVEYLKSDKHGWKNLHAKALAETDPVKQGRLRKEATIADYYLGSVHALTEDGILLIASNTGSQLPGIVYNSQNVIFVISTKKIVKNLDEAWQRLHDHVIPLEDDHMQELYGINTMESKVLIYKQENPMFGRNIQVIVVKEDLGF